MIKVLSRHFVNCYHEILQVAVVETGGNLSQLAEAAFNRLSQTAKSQLTGLLAPLLYEDASLTCTVSDFWIVKVQ